MEDLDRSEASGLEIAIVGMAGRFPGAPDIDTFWSNIRDGVESLVRYSDAELRERGVPEQRLADPAYVKAGMPLEGVELFDAGFFGYTPRDAELLDPQHRIFLECAWAALEHAGCDPRRGRVGVYAGSGAGVYLMRQLLPHQDLDDGGSIADMLGLLSGNMSDALCTRVAYKLDLRGPAVTVQSACSTSLLAVHTACQALLGHECEVALAGGVSLNLLQNGGYRYEAGAILSPDGHCRAFDARAAGTLIGSGAGVVVLKRLDDALRDGDTICAVIKGSAANNDGADKVGFTAPSVGGQAAAIRAAQAMAGVEPATIGYVEAHGTGTTLGDPIEFAALSQAFRIGRESAGKETDLNGDVGKEGTHTGFCALGSVKTNIGHLDAAAGVAGLIKAALALQHRTLPPSLHFEQPNPQIDFTGSPFYVPTRAQPWPRGSTPRRAGVSAFGIGGTNVHVVLEEAAASSVPVAGAPPAALDQIARHDTWQVLPLSARSSAALTQLGKNLATHLQQDSRQQGLQSDLADIAQTLQLGRRAFEYRRAVVADSAARAAAALQTDADIASTPAHAPAVAFLFPGGGVQHVNMGLALYRDEPVFKAELDRCCELLRPELGIDLRTLLYPAGGSAAEAEADAALSQMKFAQPALFTLGYSLAKLWLARGVNPATMLGHSLGEYVAACIAGVFSLDDALRIVAARGRLLHSLPPGAMTAVPLAEHELESFLATGCDVAAVNGERLCVLSGPLASIEAAEQALRARGIEPNRLHIAIASHSAMTEPLLDELEQRVAAVPRQAPRLPFISSVTGRLIEAAQATSPAYWAQHLRGTVRFADGLAELLRSGCAVLEVGPGEALSALARQHPLASAAAGIWPSQAHPQQRASNPQRMAQAIAGLWCAGVDIDWAACHPRRARRRVPLPGYPFQRRRYWVEAPRRGPTSMRRTARAGGALYVPAWERAAAEPHATKSVPWGDCTTLILDDGTALALALVDQLEALGNTVVRIEAGPICTRLGPNRYGVRPGERADFETVLRAVAEELPSVGVVFCLWSVGAGESSFANESAAGKENAAVIHSSADVNSSADANSSADVNSSAGINSSAGKKSLAGERTVADPESVVDNEGAAGKEAAINQGSAASKGSTISKDCITGQNSTLERGFFSVLALVQALENATSSATGIRLIVAASEAEDVTGGEPLCAEKATLFPLCKVIAQEYPQISCRFVDIVSSSTPAHLNTSATALAARQLLVEADRERNHDAAVAYRGPNRWLKTFEPLHLPDAATAQHQLRLRRGGTYVITGGLGGVGLVLAQHLVQHWQAQLILFGRAGVPDHSEWQTLIDDPMQSPSLRRRLQQLLDLEHAGAEVMTLAADVSDRGQMSSALAHVRQRFGAIHGVIHAAGQSESGLLGSKTRADVERVFSAKIDGTRVLLDVFSEDSLDFMLFCSSISSVTGGLGKGAYAAANGYLDVAAILASRRSPYPVIAVDWDAWRGLGMAAGMKIPDGIGWSGPEGARVFEQIVNGPAYAQIVISTTDLQQRLGAIDGGMLDALALPAADSTPRRSHPRPPLLAEYVAAAGAVQEQLAALWTDMLGISPIGIHDNLFELGGDSLVAIQVLSRVKQRYRADIHPSQFFKAPTIAALCERLGAATATDIEHTVGEAPLQPIPRAPQMPLSPMQRRLWVVDRLSSAQARAAYNMFAALDLDGALDTDRVARALAAIVARHEVLRTVFVEDENGDPFAAIAPALVIEVPLIDAASTAQQDELFGELAQRPFELASGPLLRAALLRHGERRHTLLLVVHHIVFDGWSVAVFAREFGEFYRAFAANETPRLPVLPVQYVDYAAWHQRVLDSKLQQGSAAFWQDYLRAAPLLSTFKPDFARPPVASFAGSSLKVAIDADRSEALQRFARARGTSLFTVLLSVFLLVLHREAGADDVVLGTDVAGRSHPDLESLLGFFVNVVPLRSKKADPMETFEGWLARVEDTSLAAMDHQGVPFDQIVDLAGAVRSRDCNPLVQVLFVLQNTPDIQFEIAGVDVAIQPQAETHSKFDLAVFVRENSSSIDVEWVFATALFERSRMQQLAEEWAGALQKASENPAAAIDVLLRAGNDMPQSKRPASGGKLDKLSRIAARTAAPRSARPPVEIKPLADERPFPLLIKAVGAASDPAGWAVANRALIDDLLLKHGAILFRDFALETPAQFEMFAESIEPRLYGEYGDLPKKEGGRNTYRSTPYPERQMILYHNESSHLQRWPRKQLFFCELPSQVGGATPIVDGREMLRRLPPALVEKLEQVGLLYVRTFVPRLDVSWQDFFKTDDRAEVEARLDAANTEWRWLDGHVLQTRTRCPAVIAHPISGARAFFNQIQLHHVGCLDADVRADLLALVGAERMPRQVYFGDGTPLDDDVIAIIGEIYEQCAVRFDWRAGDVVMLDNMLAAHARDPYEEPRRIVVAMGDMYDRAMLAAAANEATLEYET